MPGHLHIISFNVPYPPNYGGVIDVYYKLVWLHRAGVKVHLHCFEYGREPSPELERLCEKVYYYKRQTGFLAALSLLPYTVASRRSSELERNLLADNSPILFEVLHTCYLLNDPRFAARRKIYRHSNIEHDYYMELSRSEKSLFKRWYLKLESYRLKKFEKILEKADLILAVNQRDTTYFTKKFPGVRTEYLPSFHANEKVTTKTGRGEYILFHGNLGISENYDAADWLIENVFSGLQHSVIIAGLNPPQFLKEKIKKHAHISLEADPPGTRMTQLVQDAQVHVLFTAQPTGLKLKLLNVLFAGRFIVCNSHMLSGTGLQPGEGLLVCNDSGEMIRQVSRLMHEDFTLNHVSERQLLVKPFDNSINTARLVSLIG